MDRFLAAWFIYFACTVFVFEIVCTICPFLNKYYYFIARNVFALIIGHWFFLFTQERIFKKRISPNRKAVFITGCDSGFGFQAARQLDSKGFHVFAGYLFPKSEGATELKSFCSSRFRTVPIDVTQDDSVQSAKEFVINNLGDSELWAIVNNAGILKGFAADFTEVSDYTDNFQVNALGQVKVTKAFLPHLKQSRGRIVNVNSIAGRIALPSFTAYAMSKFAAVAFTEGLRRELKGCGIKVISVEPSGFKTSMTRRENVIKQLETLKAHAEEKFKTSYGKRYFEHMKLALTCIDMVSSSKTYHVTDSIEAAVSMQNPCPVYKPRGSTVERIAFNCLELLPTHFADFIIRIINVIFPVIEPLCSAFI